MIGSDPDRPLGIAMYRETRQAARVRRNAPEAAGDLLWLPSLIWPLLSARFPVDFPACPECEAGLSGM